MQHNLTDYIGTPVNPAVDTATTEIKMMNYITTIYTRNGSGSLMLKLNSSMHVQPHQLLITYT